MSDLISRQQAIDALMDRFKNSLIGQKAATDTIKALPSAERKTGHWRLYEDGWYCSNCELYPPFDCDPEEKGIPYCPNCGARME